MVRVMLCVVVFGLSVAAPAVAQEARAAGEKLFTEQKCTLCHSVAGKGNAKGPLDEVGIWTIAEQPRGAAAKDQPKEPMLELACNLAAKTESSLNVPESWQTTSVVPIAAASWFVRPIWFYLAACAWLVAIGEWFLYQRRWIS